MSDYHCEPRTASKDLIAEGPFSARRPWPPCSSCRDCSLLELAAVDGNHRSGGLAQPRTSSTKPDAMAAAHRLARRLLTNAPEGNGGISRRGLACRGSSFWSAEWSGVSRGECENLSSVTVRRTNAVTAAYSSSEKSIVGMCIRLCRANFIQTMFVAWRASGSGPASSTAACHRPRPWGHQSRAQQSGDSYVY
jgi:hypothetical protein